MGALPLNFGNLPQFPPRLYMHRPTIQSLYYSVFASVTFVLVRLSAFDATTW